MVEVRLQLQEAAALGISASDKELASAARGIREKYGLEEEAFLGAIREQGFTEKKYMALLREQITIRKLIEREVRDRVEATDLDVKAYLASKGLTDGDQYRLRQIFFSLPKNEEGESALAEKTAKVLEALKSGADFASVAAAYSEARGARATGGDMGFIEKENLSPEFVSALEGLAPGAYSGPFRTGGGVHFLMLVEKKGVRDVVFEQRFEAEHKKWLRALRSRAFVELRL
jgi:peptidyl-prolyl cis-trans isomerase SurA